MSSIRLVARGSQQKAPLTMGGAKAVAPRFAERRYTQPYLIRALQKGRRPKATPVLVCVSQPTVLCRKDRLLIHAREFLTAG